MRRAILAGITSCAVTYAAAPHVRRILSRVGALDIPNHRSSHSVPVARGGGLACAAGVVVGLVAAGRNTGVPHRVITGVGALTAIGLADDLVHGLPPATRFGVQLFTGGLFASGPACIPATSLGASGVVNVVNFMDGINGISGSTAAIWGLSTLLIGRSRLDSRLQVLGAITCGAGIGFLPWNVPNAELFLGDVGSYLFGGLMAAAIAGVASEPDVAWVVAAPLLPYAADAGQAIIRRAIGGRPLTEAHREHVYQRLVDDHGLSHVQVSALHAGVSALVAQASRPPHSLASSARVGVCIAGYLLSPKFVGAVRRGRS